MRLNLLVRRGVDRGVGLSAAALAWLRRTVVTRPARWTERHIDRIAMLAGVGLVIGGVGRMHVPTAMILAGVLLIGGVLWRPR